MSRRFDEEMLHDYDEADEPRGTDPLIRNDNGVTWFKHKGCWWQVGCLPEEARKAYLAEAISRERRGK
jgi:hypothetical protein